MMRGLVATLEKHHKIRILDEAVSEAVRLSHRYIAGRQLPDKSVSLLDTACARVAISQSATPAEIEDRQREVAALSTEIDILGRELAIGQGDAGRLDELKQRRETVKNELTGLEDRLKKERELVDKIVDLRTKLEQQLQPAAPAAGGKPAQPVESASPTQLEGWRKELAAANEGLKGIQGETPLLHPCVDGGAIAEDVANWTGIPVGRMVSNEIRAVLTLKDRMSERIVGQPHALDTIAQAIRTSRAKLTDPRKPIGVFLMVGTSGVGKTETALTLADLLYGGGQNITLIHMSGIKEEHKISTLIGSPPGSVRSGAGRRPTP